MNDMLQRQRWSGTRHLHFLSAVGMSVLFALAVCGTALGQEPAAQIEVSGKVTTPEGHPISGVTVRVRGGSTNTSTDAQGNYSILAPPDGVLTFNLIGFRGTGLGIAGRTTMNVALDRAMAVLPEGVVSGKVTTPEGHPISGVTVRVRGGSTNTSTDAQGNYSILAPPDGVLTFNLIGFRGTGLGIAGRTTMNVALDRAMAVLPEVVVTGYTSQRRSDITGAVGTVDVENLQKQTTTSVLH